MIVAPRLVDTFAIALITLSAIVVIRLFNRFSSGPLPVLTHPTIAIPFEHGWIPAFDNRDRGTPHGAAPPPPPGIRVTYPAVRSG